MNKKHSRRTFIQNLVAGAGIASSSSLSIFLGNVASSLLNQAEALAAGDEQGAFSDKKFISLIMAGGIPRYYWDLPLTPNGNDKFVANPMVITKFNSGSSLSASYATVKIGDYYFPHLWSGKIPTANGNTVAMSSLLNNFLSIRGIDLQIDSHELDLQRQLAPVLGGVSLNGLLADRSDMPIPAVGKNGNIGNYYKSKLGVAYSEMSGTNPLDDAIKNFKKNDGMLSLKTSEIEGAVDDLLRSMASTSGELNRYLPYTYQARLNAKKIMMRQFDNLSGVYTELKGKYEALISRCFDHNDSALWVSGLDDIDIKCNTGELFRREQSTSYSGSLQELTFHATTIGSLAASMAVTEFMITQNLTSSANCVLGGIGGIPHGNPNFPIDAHETGAYTALLLYSRYYKAIAACLYELRSKLGSTFNKTVIGVTTEFNRRPRSSGNGSDHGWEGSSYTIMSGMLNGTNIIGNIKSDSNANYAGTWGLAAPYLNGQVTRIGNVASTIAQLLDISSPTPDDDSLLDQSNAPVLPQCKNS